VIVYFLPRGVTGLVEDALGFLRAPTALPRGLGEAVANLRARMAQRQPSGGG
jgi:hypothetical protein